MSVPKPPFHSVTDELLYNIYLKVMGSSGRLNSNDINTLAKLNAIITDSDLMSRQEIINIFNTLKGTVPEAGNTLEKLYNLINGLNFLTQDDIDTITELNAIINDADLARSADIQALKGDVPVEGDSLHKLYNLIAGLLSSQNNDASPPSVFLDFDVPVTNLSLGAFNNGGGLGATPGYSAFGVDAVQNCFGVLMLGTASSTAGGSYLSTVFRNIVLGIGYKILIRGRIALEILSDDANSFLIYFGLGGVPFTRSNPSHGVFFRYNHLLNGGRWEAVCRQTDTETAVDTGLTADIATYHIFEMRINAAGTLVDFFIDDMDVPVATIADNIPNGATQSLLFFGKIEKTAGNTARNVYFDFIKYVPSRTSPIQ